jgi:hypothetical protein
MTQDWRPLKPAWWQRWQLYAIGLLLLSLLALMAALVDAGTGRTILELAVVALVCPWMVAWVWCGRAATELEEWRGHYRPHARVIAPPSEDRQASRYGTDDRRRRNAPLSRADSRRPTPRGPGQGSGGRIWTENLAGGAALRFRLPVFKKPRGAPTGG